MRACVCVCCDFFFFPPFFFASSPPRGPHWPSVTLPVISVRCVLITLSQPQLCIATGPPSPADTHSLQNSRHALAARFYTQQRQEAGEQIEINAAKSRTCTVLLLSVSLPLIYNGKAIHSQLPCLPYGYAKSLHENYSQSLAAGWERAEGGVGGGGCTEIKVFLRTWSCFCS